MRETLLLLGLGNPGQRYDGTRHNVGFDCIDRLAGRFGTRLKRPLFRRFEIAQTPYLLCKPLTYMNRSGEVLPHIMHRYAVDSVCPVVDNMDLAPGEIRMKTRGSSSNHNGLKSIEQILESSGFPRIYVGIGRPEEGVGVIEHVLGTPNGDSGEAIRAAIDRLSEILFVNTERSIDQLATAINAARRPVDG